MPPVSFPWESYIYTCSILEKVVRKLEKGEEREERGRERKRERRVSYRERINQMEKH
jgi:hypothetical protein